MAVGSVRVGHSDTHPRVSLSCRLDWATGLVMIDGVSLHSVAGGLGVDGWMVNEPAVVCLCITCHPPFIPKMTRDG